MQRPISERDTGPAQSLSKLQEGGGGGGGERVQNPPRPDRGPSSISEEGTIASAEREEIDRGGGGIGAVAYDVEEERIPRQSEDVATWRTQTLILSHYK